MSRQRYTFDDIWTLFVEACGNRCCADCMTEMPVHRLQKGHVHRYADLSPATLDNLIPVCADCNGKYSLKDTPDRRPPDWRSRFLKLLAGRWNLSVYRKKAGAGVSEAGEGVASLSQPQDADSAIVIPWAEIEFRYQSEVPTRVATGVSLPPTEKDITIAVRDAMRRGKDHDISLPSGKVQSDMRRLATFWTPRVFLAAVTEYLAQHDMRGADARLFPPYHEWERFCDANTFQIFLADHKTRTDRVAAEAKEAAAAEALRLAEEKRQASDPECIRQREERDKETAAYQRKRREAAATYRRDQMLTLWSEFSSRETDTEESERIRAMLENLSPDGDPMAFVYRVQEIQKLIRNIAPASVEAPNANLRRRQQRRNRGKNSRRG